MAAHKCCLLAVQGGYGWEYAKKIFEELKKKNNNTFELNPINCDAPKYRFRDGELKPRVIRNIRKRNCYFIHDSTLHPSEWFTQLALVNYAIKFSSAQEIIDVMPYHKFARQDVKDESRVPISAKVVADIVSMYAKRAMCLDIHNPAIQGFYNIPFDPLDPTKAVLEYIGQNNPEVLENVVIMSTDTGGGKRARKYTKSIPNSDFVEGYKYRDAPGEVEKLKILGNVSGKNVLMIDDITDSGGTFVKAAEEVRRQGAQRVYAYCTHGLFTKGLNYVTDQFDLFFVGDTLKLSSEPGKNTKVIPFAPLFAEAIFRTSEGDSLTELFS